MICYPSITEFFTAIGTVCATIVALYFGVRNLKELNDQKKVGIFIGDINLNGVGFIENNSQVDYKIQLCKYVLCDGKDSTLATDIQKEFNNSIQVGEKSEKILKRIKKIKGEELLPEQTLAPKESIFFHIHNLTVENITLVFIVLEFKAGVKDKFYLYRYANRSNLGKIESPLNDILHPCNQWVKVYSFEE